MRLTKKQKMILYTGTGLIVLMSLYANIFITAEKIDDIKVINTNQEVNIYNEKSIYYK